MNLTPEILRDLADAIVRDSNAYAVHSDEWFVYQDAADAVDDLADLIEDESNG